MSKTARAHRKFAIYSGFLDTILEGEEEIQEGETRKDTLKRILKDLEETAADLKKELNQESKLMEITRSFPPQQIGSSIMEIQTEKSGDTLAALIADIYTCTELKVLEGYRLLAKTRPELQAAYDMQTQKLNLPKPQVND
jgi:hypothetical protein